MAYLYRLQPPRPTFMQDMGADEAETMQRHMAYWQDLLDRRVALAYGPVLDPEDPWGLGLLDVDDEAAARRIGEGDPAVDAGVCAYKIVEVDLVRPAES